MLRTTRRSTWVGVCVVLGGWSAAGFLLGAGAAHALQLLPGDIVVSDPGVRAILRIDPVSGATDIVSEGGEISNPIGLALDDEGQLIVADTASGFTGSILRIDPATGAQIVLARGGLVQNPNHVAVGPAGVVYVTTDEGGHLYGNGGVLKVDPASGTPSLLLEEDRWGITSGVAVREDGSLVVAFFVRQPTQLRSEIYALDPVTGARDVISQGNLIVSPFDLALDDSGRILVAEVIDNRVVRIDPHTGAQELFPLVLPGFGTHGLRAIDFESDGSLLLLSSRLGDEGLYRIEQEGDAPKLVAALNRPLGMLVVPGLRIGVDIRPGSERNLVPILSWGVLPVAIFGSDELDVLDIDFESLVFGPAGAEQAHRRGPHQFDLDRDGHLDLLLHFRTRETGIAVGDTEACVSGFLLDGSEILGCDAIATTAGCGRGFEAALIAPLIAWGRVRIRRTT